MNERVIPLVNQLNVLRRNDEVTVVLARSGNAKPDYSEVRFCELMDGPQLPLGMAVEHEQGIMGNIPFAGSSVGIESIIVGEGEEASVIFHNSNVLFPYLPPFRHSVFTPEGEAENVQRKVGLGLGSADEIRESLRG